MNIKKMDFPDRDLFILADGDYRGYRSGACEKEPETVEWLRRVAPGSVVWDVGASVGPYSLVAAALGAERVIAFEPYGPSYGHLCQNISINKMDRQIDAWPIALWRDTFYAHLGFATSAPGAGSHQSSGGIPQAAIFATADAVSIDTGWPPEHIKIDVDGTEIDVIEGGRTVWHQAQSVMVESTERVMEDIGVILSGCGLEQTGKWLRSGEQWNYLFERGA